MNFLDLEHMLFSCILLLAWQTSLQAQPLSLARHQMVRDEIQAAGVDDPRVISSMLKTPRHEFVLPKYRPRAYFDMSLPIGEGQTISSPFIVAFMTASLDPQPTDKVLEIGTGSGYQAAVLSPLVKHVYSIEIVESLGRRAKRTLAALDYKNVSVRIGDGFQGWAEAAPFDKIIVTCSPEEVPQPLVDHLREGGLMVVPVGERYQQTLYLFTKRDGKLEPQMLRPTLFVPMTGIAEAQREVQPDPTHPVAVNGSFEQPVGEDGNLPGWYYGRQVERVEATDAPDGQFFARFTNEDDGRGSRLLQGLAIDGQAVRKIKLSTWFRCRSVRPSSDQQLPLVAITFYDHLRREIGNNWIGPWRGTHSDWKKYEQFFPVPANTKEAILRVGLFGAMGQADFDDVRIERQ